ncbi:MAG: FHA domain-containing protein [Acidobacteria bacterium]|nr:FHA domain-containing protein [Acidobacteriota bacterium]
MSRVLLNIRGPYETKTVEVENEVSIGRTDASSVVIDDAGLSRKNTTFFRDGDDVLVVDENSTNGTILNGEKLVGAPKIVKNGDEVKLGNGTTIRVEFETKASQAAMPATATAPAAKTPTPVSKKQQVKKQKSEIQNQTMLIAAIGLSVVIVALGAIALVIVNNTNIGESNGGRNLPPQPEGLLIPIRVTDPLGGEDPDDLDDLIASWEVEEKELDLKTLQDVKVSETDASGDEKYLEVTAAFLANRKAKSFEARSGVTGISPPGLKVPAELRGDGVVKQKLKLAQMKSTGYRQPLDFSDLAQKRLARELIEMPMATDSFYLEVGGSATTEPFTSFSFETGDVPIQSGSAKFQPLISLASKYGVSLDNPTDRKQIRMRLLRMFNKGAKPVLEEVARAYYEKYNRPLRVTSLTRSMDYQISLNKTNANSFKVRDANSLPPHTSGCAFDLARKHMTVDEQNFVMEKLAEMERARKLDALIEYGTNACWHIFIYYDGVAP